MHTRRAPVEPAAGDFLPLSPAIHHILLALVDEERHGYGIMLEVSRLTGGDDQNGAWHPVRNPQAALWPLA
jgi:hypothetical protein